MTTHPGSRSCSSSRGPWPPNPPGRGRCSSPSSPVKRPDESDRSICSIEMAEDRAPLRLRQPRHRRPARRWRALCPQRRLGARVALHLHGCRLHHRRARQGRRRAPRQLGSDELHRARDPRGTALHRTDTRLPPTLRHRRHHRRGRHGRGDRSRPRGGGLSRRAVWNR